MADPIPPCEPRRDQLCFRALQRHGLSDDDRRRLFAHKPDYRKFRARLLKLAAQAGIRTNIWPRERAEKD